jgi:hypothetical protein
MVQFSGTRGSSCITSKIVLIIKRQNKYYIRYLLNQRAPTVRIICLAKKDLAIVLLDHTVLAAIATWLMLLADV